uniref:Uncharacterized LOC107593629 n=1 Tax=Sinocyclocheilus grahami TaxID=75366 RepID=A0A672SAR0_SINGR
MAIYQNTSSKKTNKAYNCSYCPHSFRFPNNLKLHERAHLAKTVIPCSKCGKFYRKRKFKDHVELCNGDKMKPACGKCGRVFTRKNYRNGHEKQCQGKQNKTDTEKETGTGTNEKGKFKQKCPQCFKCFRSSSFLQRHLSLHSKETAYACMHCGQKFDIKNQKEGAVVPGENGEALKCKFCTKSFLRARYLRRHILTHTEVKPYRCKTCESCFSRYDHLKLHQAHGDMLQCKYCPRRFKLSGQLKVHVRLHTGEKPYGCANCGEHFIRTDY